MAAIMGYTQKRKFPGSDGWGFFSGMTRHYLQQLGQILAS